MALMARALTFFFSSRRRHTRYWRDWSFRRVLFRSEEGRRRYVCVYPFGRSYEWYLLPDEERRDMLKEHGMQARPYPDVRANTVASFGLGDYEWLLAFEADELHRIVDLMRDLRASRARRHVREEVPFYTGTRKPVTELVAELPRSEESCVGKERRSRWSTYH